MTDLSNRKAGAVPEAGGPHPLTLRFPDATLEARFEAEYRTGALRYYRWLAATLLGFMVLISLTGLGVEFSVNRTGIQALLWAAMIPATALALGALFLKPLRGHRAHVVHVYLFVMGVICVLHPRVRGDVMLAETYGYSYTAFFLFLMLAFSRLAPLRALLGAVVTVLAHATTMGSWIGVEAVIRHVPLLAGASALGFSVGYLMERNVRALFAARAAVEDRERQLVESEARLREAHDKSEALLLSVLPRSIAERLKAEGRSIADGIVECTVLFADLVGFTALAQEMGPRALVTLLNDLFSRFDALCDKYGLEKIKTIGDAYMAAAGVPEYSADHPQAAADMALAMIEEVRDFNRQHESALGLRIGLHSGPVVAGIIGTRKFSYDLWGDAVNTAARMESHGLPGKVHVTDVTARLLRRTHELADRDPIEVKGKGLVQTSWVIRRRT